MRPPVLLVVSSCLLALLLPVAGMAQPKGFHAVSSSDGVDVWAVGDSGRVFRSFDGGSNWKDLILGARSLRGVATRSLTTIVVGDSGKIWRSQDAGGSWDLRIWAGAPDLMAIDMPSDQTAYVVGENGTILATADAGDSWTAQTSGTGENLHAVRFVDEQNGWAVGANGRALRTQSGGANWTPLVTGTVNSLLSVDVRGAEVWAVGEEGTAIRSLNQGDSWSHVNLNLDARSDVRAVHLRSPSRVFLVGGGGFVRWSDDAGATWQFPIHSIQAQISDVHFVGNAGWAVSNKKWILMSTSDGGTTWNLPVGATVSRSWDLKLPFAGQARGRTFDLDGTYKNTIYCALGATVYRSRDAGDTWQAIATIPQTSRINSFFVSPRDSNVMVAAVSGIVPRRLVKSDDQGQNWFTTLEHDFGEYGLPMGRDPDRPDTLYFGGDSDSLFRSTDGGKNWYKWSSTVFRSPCVVLPIPGQASTILVGDGITGSGNAQYFQSTNWGRDFVLRQTRPLGASEIPGMASGRLRNSNAYGTNWGSGGVQRSIDYGTTWNNITSTGAAWGIDVSMDDPNCVIFGVYSGGLSYLSLDGGSSFTTSALPGSNYSLFARDRGLILAQQSAGIYKMNVTYVYRPGDLNLQLTSPVGGETLQYGQVHPITWSAQGLTSVRIEYRTEPGGTWNTIAASVPAGSSPFHWSVPNVTTSRARIRVRDTEGTSFDVSAGEFSIVVPGFLAEPDPLELLLVMVGSTQSGTLYLGNPGPVPVTVSSVVSDKPNFRPARTSLVLPAGGSDTLGVFFEAIAAGSDTALFTITTNDPSSPHTVMVIGQATTNVAVGDRPATAFALRQNQPNPFHGSTLIRYSLPTALPVTLDVFDLQGQRVARLVQAEQGPGEHSAWFGPRAVAADGSRLGRPSAGVYFYHLRAGSFSSTRKMLLLK